MNEMQTQAATAFATALQTFTPGKPVWVLGHNDADGLSATALFARVLGSASWAVRTRVVGRGESPWSDAMRAELAGEAAAGLIITDLGVRSTLPMPGTPTVLVDHHVVADMPEGCNGHHRLRRGTDPHLVAASLLVRPRSV